MQIRTGKTTDIPDIAALLIHSWQKHYTFLPENFLANLSLDHQIQRHSRLMSGNATYFVCDIEERFAGFASYGPSRVQDEYHHELYTLYVHPDFQRNGIGALLLDAVLGSISTSIYVEVMELNPFRAFYGKNGFTIVDQSQMDLDGFKVNNLIYASAVEINNISEA